MVRTFFAATSENLRTLNFAKLVIIFELLCVLRARARGFESERERESFKGEKSCWTKGMLVFNVSSNSRPIFRKRF